MTAVPAQHNAEESPVDPVPSLPPARRRMQRRRRSGPPATVRDAIRRATRAGMSALWTGDCSATIVLSRLTGPSESLVPEKEARRFELDGDPPWELSDPTVRRGVYQHVLVHGTQFDCYRWIDLIGLAQVWPRLNLPDGVHTEWRQVLEAADLLDPVAPTHSG